MANDAQFYVAMSSFSLLSSDFVTDHQMEWASGLHLRPKNEHEKAKTFMSDPRHSEVNLSHSWQWLYYTQIFGKTASIILIRIMTLSNTSFMVPSKHLNTVNDLIDARRVYLILRAQDGALNR